MHAYDRALLGRTLVLTLVAGVIALAVAVATDEAHSTWRMRTARMSAFTPAGHRRTTIFGTTGWLVGNGAQIEHHDFRSNHRQVYEVEGRQARHGGGDDALMAAFLRAVAHREPSRLLSGPDDSLAGHLLVFAAEQARRERRVVAIGEAQTEGVD